MLFLDVNLDKYHTQLVGCILNNDFPSFTVMEDELEILVESNNEDVTITELANDGKIISKFTVRNWRLLVREYTRNWINSIVLSRDKTLNIIEYYDAVKELRAEVGGTDKLVKGMNMLISMEFVSPQKLSIDIKYTNEEHILSMEFSRCGWNRYVRALKTYKEFVEDTLRIDYGYDQL